MIYRMYAVYDATAQVYTTPFAFRHEGEAVRSFTESLQPGQNTAMSKYPNEFGLYYLGAYDDNAGIGSYLTAPERVIDGNSALKPKD